MGVDHLIGLIMAGGKASRFREPVEKGMLKVGGRSLLDRSLDALCVEGIDDIAVAVTPHTPRTREQARRMDVWVIDTDGTGYHEDINQLLEDMTCFATVNVDTPFIRKNHVAGLLARFDGGSLAGVAPESRDLPPPDEDSIAVDDRTPRLIWIGMNIVTPDPNTAMALFEDPLLTVNVNDEESLERADRIALKLGI